MTTMQDRARAREALMRIALLTSEERRDGHDVSIVAQLLVEERARSEASAVYVVKGAEGYLMKDGWWSNKTARHARRFARAEDAQDRADKINQAAILLNVPSMNVHVVRLVPKRKR